MILLIAFITIGIYLSHKENKEWVVFYESTGNNQIAIQKFAFLKSRNIRCKMKTITPKLNGRTGGMVGNVQMTVKVLVHKEDLNKVYNLTE